jgi:hypothetical protein
VSKPAHRRPRRALALWLLGGGLVVLVGAFVAAQLVLPGLAAQRLRERVAPYGTVQSASVQAFPALQLLWDHADSAQLDAASMHIDTAQASQLLWSARGINDLRVAIADLWEEALLLQNVRLEKHGADLFGEASVTQADLGAVLGAGIEVVPLASSSGETLEVQLTGALFGISASVNALVRAESGKLVAQPQAAIPGFLGPVTLFSAAHVSVQGIGLTSQPDTTTSGYRLHMRAQLE